MPLVHAGVSCPRSLSSHAFLPSPQVNTWSLTQYSFRFMQDQSSQSPPQWAEALSEVQGEEPLTEPVQEVPSGQPSTSPPWQNSLQ